MRDLGGNGSGAPRRPDGRLTPGRRFWCAGNTANSGPGATSSAAMFGVVQSRSQEPALLVPASSASHPWQSGMTSVSPADTAISRAIEFALTACTTLPAANRARNMMARICANFCILSGYDSLTVMSIHTGVRQKNTSGNPRQNGFLQFIFYHYSYSVFAVGHTGLGAQLTVMRTLKWPRREICCARSAPALVNPSGIDSCLPSKPNRRG